MGWCDGPKETFKTHNYLEYVSRLQRERQI